MVPGRAFRTFASVLFTFALYTYVKCTCQITSTRETLADCQWSRWCWDCKSCGKPGDTGQVLLLRGTCCAAPNDDPADCATHCGIPMTTDFNMTTFSTCVVKCGNKSDPSICKGIDDTSSGSGTTTGTNRPTTTTYIKIATTATIKPPPTTASICKGIDDSSSGSGTTKQNPLLTTSASTFLTSASVISSSGAGRTSWNTGVASSRFPTASLIASNSPGPQGTDDHSRNAGTRRRADYTCLVTVLLIGAFNALVLK